MVSHVNLRGVRALGRDASEEASTAGKEPSHQEPLAERKVTAVLTEEERLALREGLQAAGLRGHVAEAIAGYAVPSLEFSAATSTTVPVGATKIGGRPDLPEETAWPRRSDRIRERAMEPVLGAIPLAFLAQVDLAEAARALPPDENPLPAAGLLSFFYDAYDQPWGYDPEDRHDFRVIYSGPAEDLVPATLPEDLPEVCRFAPRAASLHRKPSLPSVKSEEIYDLGLTDEEEEGYLAFRDARRSNPSRMHFGSGLLGYPDAVQDARMEVECELLSHGIDPEVYWGAMRAGGVPPTRIAALAERVKGAWRLLLQLDTDSESGMEWWYDTGMLYFWVTERGLGEEDFDEVWVLLQTT
jgi:uncharacterized protein YwqG